jgi:hypothetical protein
MAMQIVVRLQPDHPAVSEVKKLRRRKRGSVSGFVRQALAFYIQYRDQADHLDEALAFYAEHKDRLPLLMDAIGRLAEKYDELEAGVVAPADRRGAAAAADIPADVAENLGKRAPKGKKYE